MFQVPLPNLPLSLFELPNMFKRLEAEEVKGISQITRILRQLGYFTDSCYRIRITREKIQRVTDRILQKPTPLKRNRLLVSAQIS